MAARRRPFNGGRDLDFGPDQTNREAMGNSITTAGLTRSLAAKQRVIMLGGLAVISHGHARPTYDADIWLDPNLSPGSWAEVASGLTDEYPILRFVAIGSWMDIPRGDLAEAIARDGVVRLMGANQPLDIFRDPNEIEMASFDEVWARAQPLEDGTRLPDVVDLLLSKQDTGRDKDMQDIAFLEAKAEREYLEKLPLADETTARQMLDRFLTPKVAEAALSHSSAAVRDLGMRFLHELADEGNPFAADILKTLK